MSSSLLSFLNLSSILAIQSVDYRPEKNDNESQLTYLMCHYKLIVTTEQKQTYIAHSNQWYFAAYGEQLQNCKLICGIK